MEQEPAETAELTPVLVVSQSGQGNQMAGRDINNFYGGDRFYCRISPHPDKADTVQWRGTFPPDQIADLWKSQQLKVLDCQFLPRGYERLAHSILRLWIHWEGGSITVLHMDAWNAFLHRTMGIPPCRGMIHGDGGAVVRLDLCGFSSTIPTPRSDEKIVEQELSTTELSQRIETSLDKWMWDYVNEKVLILLEGSNPRQPLALTIDLALAAKLQALWVNWSGHLAGRPQDKREFLQNMMGLVEEGDRQASLLRSGPLAVNKCLLRTIVYSLAIASGMVALGSVPCRGASLANLRIGDHEGHLFGAECIFGNEIDQVDSGDHWTASWALLTHFKDKGVVLQALGNNLAQNTNRTSHVQSAAVEKLFFTGERDLLIAMASGEEAMNRYVSEIADDWFHRQSVQVENSVKETS